MIVLFLAAILSLSFVLPPLAETSEMFVLREYSIRTMSNAEILAEFRKDIELSDAAPERLYLAWRLLARSELRNDFDHKEELQREFSRKLTQFLKTPRESLSGSNACTNAEYDLWTEFVLWLESRRNRLDVDTQAQRIQALAHSSSDLLSMCDNSPLISYPAGLIFLESKDWEAAKGCFETLHALEPETRTWVSYLIFSCGRLGLHEERLRLIELLWELGDDPQNTYSIYAKSLGALGRYEEARWYQKQALKSVKKEPPETRLERVREMTRLGLPNLNRLTAKYMKDKKYDKALSTSMKALELARTAKVHRKAIAEYAAAILLSVENRIKQDH